MARNVPVEVYTPLTLDSRAIVMVAGQVVTDAVHAVQIDVRHGCVNEVHIDLAMPSVLFVGDAAVTVPDNVRHVLVALGWTPPDGA
jgi:hypothetical protein